MIHSSDASPSMPSIFVVTMPAPVVSPNHLNLTFAWLGSPKTSDGVLNYSKAQQETSDCFDGYSQKSDTMARVQTGMTVENESPLATLFSSNLDFCLQR